MHYSIKTLILALVCSVTACTQHDTSGKTPVGPASDAATAQFANATDFVCGMKVTAEYEDTCHYQGKAYGFCSASCKEAFLEEPDKYLAGK